MWRTISIAVVVVVASSAILAAQSKSREHQRDNSKNVEKKENRAHQNPLTQRHDYDNAYWGQSFQDTRSQYETVWQGSVEQQDYSIIGWPDPVALQAEEIVNRSSGPDRFWNDNAFMAFDGVPVHKKSNQTAQDSDWPTQVTLSNASPSQGMLGQEPLKRLPFKNRSIGHSESSQATNWVKESSQHKTLQKLSDPASIAFVEKINRESAADLYHDFKAHHTEFAGPLDGFEPWSVGQGSAWGRFAKTGEALTEQTAPATAGQALQSARVGENSGSENEKGAVSTAMDDAATQSLGAMRESQTSSLSAYLPLLLFTLLGWLGWRWCGCQDRFRDQAKNRAKSNVRHRQPSMEELNRTKAVPRRQGEKWNQESQDNPCEANVSQVEQMVEPLRLPVALEDNVQPLQKHRTSCPDEALVDFCPTDSAELSEPQILTLKLPGQESSSDLDGCRTGSLEQDDLTKIRGIGPATNRVLSAHGISSFEQIAEMNCVELKDIFADCRERFPLLNVEAWVQQAQDLLRDDNPVQILGLEKDILKNINLISEEMPPVPVDCKQD